MVAVLQNLKLVAGAIESVLNESRESMFYQKEFLFLRFRVSFPLNSDTRRIFLRRPEVTEGSHVFWHRRGSLGRDSVAITPALLTSVLWPSTENRVEVNGFGGNRLSVKSHRIIIISAEKLMLEKEKHTGRQI